MSGSLLGWDRVYVADERPDVPVHKYIYYCEENARMGMAGRWADAPSLVDGAMPGVVWSARRGGGPPIAAAAVVAINRNRIRL